MEYVVIDERSFKEKASDAARTVKEKAGSCAKFLWENRRATISAAMLGATAVTSLVGKINRHKELRESEIRHTKSFYDRSMGCYWETKRPLKTDEMLELEQRRSAGENYGQILRDMGLLKRVR